jgi:tetraacyldisaccharide 4'-kinase
MVKWLATWLQGQGLRVVIVSRGYGTSAGTANDEALELQQSLPDVPHVQNRDRVAAARTAIKRWNAQVILADDAFQHRRLARDLDIVLIDCLEPFGYGHLFPRGTLREPVGSLRRADGVCLTRVDMVNPAQLNSIRSRIQNVVPELPCCEAAHKPSRLIDHCGNVRPLNDLAGVSVAAFCGIGNPNGFRHTLLSTGCNLVAWREFGDHHQFKPGDLNALTSWVRESGAHEVVCTHKDLVKLPVEKIDDVRLSAVVVELEILKGQRALEEMLSSAVIREQGNSNCDLQDFHLGTTT